MELGKKIAYYRKSKNITQDTLAKQLGISNQAVSKWETDQSCPDVELLPKIADIFEITLDDLFGRTDIQQQETGENSEEVLEEGLKETGETEVCSTKSSETLSGNKMSLPWEDDEKLRAVLFIGHKLVQKNELQETERNVCQEITFCYEGPARNVESYFNVSCDKVSGNITAGGYVECGEVGQCITAGACVSCGDVGESVAAGAYVECGDVGESVTAGAYVECNNVEGNVSAGGNVECNNVGGSVTAEGNVECNNVKGDVSADGDVTCNEIKGDVSAEGNVIFDN